MATYNFTIRATDNVGAYSDRDFNLTVNNTVYDRFVIVGNTGLVRSPDGINWTFEDGLSGFGVNFGGGQWLVWTNTTIMRRSVDGTNWITYTPTFTGNPGAISFVNHLRYINGAWTGLFSSTVSGGGLVEMTSTDGIAWTYVALVTGTANTASADFDIDPAGNMVTRDSNTFMYRKDAVTKVWSRVGANLTFPYQNNAASTIRYYNGVWIYMAGYGAAAASCYATSVDAINWVVRPNAETITGLTYVNGRILSMIYNPSTPTSNTMYASTNAGRSFSQYGNNTAKPGLMNNASGRQGFAYFGGTLLYGVTGSGALHRSTDDGLNWTRSNLPGLTSCFAVAARDGIL
ncbi:MAG: hypothetical protein EOP83_05845 [Verrucomicrobiaceae bacterium]|nr:MAG: hypothetical protein EOP83_05845 [Verrucomicrobiaceae bacterium]